MKNNRPLFNLFNDSILIFLDYIERRKKVDSQYKPHALIRALFCAFETIENGKTGEVTMGVAHDGDEKIVKNCYIVSVKKVPKGFEILEIRNMSVNKPMPIDFMVIVFRLQINMDRIAGDTISSDYMVDILNKIVPGNIFYALGSRWREARDEFKKQLRDGKIHLPEDSTLKEELISIDWSAPWESYSNRLRALIGQAITPLLNEKGQKVIITSPQGAQIEKTEVCETVNKLFLGDTAKYLNLTKLHEEYMV